MLVECFHADAIIAYMSTSSIYESLCFAFLIGGVLYYVRIRQYGLLLSPRQIVVTVAPLHRRPRLERDGGHLSGRVASV